MVNDNENPDNVVKISPLAAVYIPFKTVQTAVAAFAQEIPNKLDKSAWPTFSNLLQGQTYSAFKFLGLIDNDGYVQPILRELAKEPLDSTKFKTTLAQILQDKYKPILELAAQHGTINQLQDKMRAFNVSGTTLERAIRFWIEAAKFAGITYPDTWKKATGGIVKRHKPGSSGSSEMGEEDNKPQLVGEQPNPDDSTQSGYSETVTLPNGIGTITLSVSINPIKLRGKSRDWFNQLIDKLGECPNE